MQFVRIIIAHTVCALERVFYIGNQENLREDF